MASGIETDFRVFPDSKVIRHVSSNDTVHEVQDFYSWLMDLFDEPGYMSYQTPIKYNTPTSYTMLNGWFLDNGDADTDIAGTGISDTGKILEYLTGGSIDTSGYATVDDPIYMMDIDAESVAFANGDKDLVVRANATDNIGPLIAYKKNYPSATTARIWIRDVNGIGAPGATEAIEVTTAGGTGTYTNSGGGAADSGDEVYANIYTIASWAGDPNAQVYIKQQHPVSGQGDIRVAEWSNADNWDRGSTSTEEIDILLPVKLGGNAIDTGNVTLFGRQTGDTFTHYVTSVSTTGASRTPIAMETSADTVNITKAEHYLLVDSSVSDVSSDFTAGDIIQDVSTANTTPPSWYAEVVSATAFTDTTTGLLTLRGLSGSITDTDAIWVGTTDTANANGTPGGTYFEASAIGTILAVTDTITGGDSGAKRVLNGVNNVASDYHFVSAVDEAIVGSAKDVYYKDFTTGETITDETTGTVTNETTSSVSLISDYTDVTIAHVNGSVTVSSVSGLFEVGEVVNYTNPSASAICLTAIDTGDTTLWLGNVDSANEPTATSVFTGASSAKTADCDSTMTDDDEANYEFTQQAEGALYGVVIEGGTVYSNPRTLEDIYAYIQYKCRDGETDVFYTSDGSSITTLQGQFYITANSGYAVSKTAPFGTLAGGVFFGAQGVWIQGMHSSDNNSITLTDQAGIIQEPDTSINVTVTNTRVDDVVSVYLEDGTTGLPDKAQYTIAVAGVAEGAATMEKTTGTDFPKDTPASGWVYVVDTSANEEHKYRYASWTGEILTLATEVTGTTESSGNTATNMKDVGNFASGVERGDIIQCTSGTNANAWCYVVEVVDNDNVTTTILSNGGTHEDSVTFTVNSPVVAYTSSDTFYIPYLEVIESTGTDASPGSETNSLLYVDNRAVGVRVRNVGDTLYEIIPFNTTNDITLTGMSQSVIRNTDEVYNPSYGT